MIRFAELTADQLRLRGGVKWDVPEGFLSASIAEMDFPIAEPIERALLDAVRGSRFGYPSLRERQRAKEACARRMALRHGFTIDPDLVEPVADVMQAMAIALEAFVPKDDAVLIQPPVYGRFTDTLREAPREIALNPLRRDIAGRYLLDLDGLERSIGPKARVLFFCNPQNPTGRVLGRDELEALANVAVRHDLLIISDEIHAELAYPGHVHVPIASLSTEIARRTITVTSPSKAFNTPGLRCAFAICGSRELYDRFVSVSEWLRSVPNVLGMEAAIAAWTECDEWLSALLAHLEAQRRLVLDFARNRLARGLHAAPEATYLAWLDCRETGPDPQAFFRDRAKVALSDGRIFGAGGEGFVRLNFGTSRHMLEAILERMARALGSP
jgi:cysteine-S-conjugate beta-lyase